MGHDHNVNKCIHLKDTIEELIKRVHLDVYVKGGKWDREESPKGKSLSNFTTNGARGESKEVCKGKFPYISAITRGEPRENLPFKGTMKRKTAKMMTIYRKEGSLLTKVPSRITLGFHDLEKFRGIPDKISPS